MKTFGESLRKAREQAGLSSEDVFRQTRISLKHIHAIESGDFPSLPQTYVRAFIREYALLVGLDADDTVERYNEIAEREKGIPRPPDSIDSSNILPRADDSIEILSPNKVIPRHVVIEGRAEVEDQDFVPPVRRSRFISGTEDSLPATPKSEADSALPSPLLVDLTGEDEFLDRRTAPSQTSQTESFVPEPSRKPGTMAETAKQLFRRFARGAGPASGSARGTMDPPHSMSGAPVRGFPLPVFYKRRGFPAVVITGLIFIVVIVGALLFRSPDGGDQAILDSAAVQDGVNAGRYIDTTRGFDLEDLLPVDTSMTEPAGEQVLEPTRVTYAQEDSLVLEAVTSAPVWYSIRMDTLRTERGNLSSNDHRVWKAKDHFHVTLGDAGAVTFFLNGREIGSLGDEGAVVKNAVISRGHLKPE